MKLYRRPLVKYKNPQDQIQSSILLVLGFFLVCIFACLLCSCTIAPTIRHSDATEYSGNTATHATYLRIEKGRGYVLTPQQLATYNSLVDRYGHGTDSRPFDPPLKPDAGITRDGATIYQDAEHQIDFRDMVDWKVNGIAPRGILDRLLK